MNYDFDLVVIGSGPAGEKGAAQAAYFGKRVAIIEKEPKPGGAAVHTGTLPSKTLRETALFLSGHRTGELYGIQVSLDRTRAVPRLLSRKDDVIQQEVARIHRNLERHNVTYLLGEARFVAPHAIEIHGDHTARIVTGDRFLIATGSVPFQPSNIPFADPDIDDSDTILQIDRMPESLTVLGGGVIGCEYAAMFAALGVKVTLIEPRDELLSFLDMEVSEALRVALVRLGVDVRLKTSGTEVKREGSHIVTVLSTGDSVKTDKFLFAAGRSGATAKLNLEAMGVKLGKRGYIEVDRGYQTSVPTIFAAGDVIGFPALASTSMEQARVAVCNAFGFDYKKGVSDLLPYGIYTIPEVSCVGLSEEDAKAKGIDVVIGRGMYENNARGKIIGDHDGMVKLVFERSSRKLLGANCIGDRATEIVHIGQALILCGGTVDTLIDMVFNYPTLSECYKYAAYDALGRWNRPDGSAPEMTAD
ncbi:MAG: Si-specific NAD(P)(+) transhydrogenase [Polyangiaceae bacterium]|nr:Si-specific NAD(P)(+) transhydrogenase [Polyangiaceae bacterium]